MSESTPPLAMEKTAPKEAAEAPQLGSLDWAAIVVAGNTSVFLLGFSPIASYRFGAMFAEFGGHVPWLTALVVRWYVPVLAGLLVAGLLVAGLRNRTPKRRRLLGIAAALGVASVASCVAGLYWPIVSIAGSIKP